jgi:hypothetical protein
MQLTFIPGTPIATTSDILSEADLEHLIEAYSKSSNKYFIFDEDNLKGENFWRDKNTSVYDIDGLDEGLVARLENAVKEAFKLYLSETKAEKPMYDMTSFATIHKWVEGASMGVHCDSSDGNDQIKYGFVYYLNEDYVGGQIYYPEYDLELQPTKGLLVLHPGDIEHGVNEVISGVRLNMTAFALDES